MATKAEEEASRLLPYVARLQKASTLGGEGLDFHVVEQSGFQGLHDMMEGRGAPTCPICYQEAQEPVVTPCVHIACADCICHWHEAAPLVLQTTDQRYRADNANQEVYILLLLHVRVHCPPVPITARVHSTPQRPFPTRRYILDYFMLRVLLCQ